MLTDLPPAIETRIKRLPAGLRDHISRARLVARELAERHQVDLTRADLGIASHDIARGLKGQDLLNEATRFGVSILQVERVNPVLLHGPVAAQWLEREDGIEDPEVLEAVRWHTTGREGMSSVAKVVFLADKLDHKKVERYPPMEKVRSLADDSLDAALLEYISYTLEYLLRKGQLIHPASIGVRNELIIASSNGPAR